MSTLRGIIARVLGFFSHHTADQEMEQEFQAHLQMEIDDNLRQGMSPDEARRLALISAGSIASAREAHRDQRGLPFLDTLFQDVRYGARILRKNPGFTFVAILILALGIGANTAIFSVVNAVLLARLPVKEQNRVVQLWETESSPGKYPLTGADYLDWESQNHTLEGSALYRYVSPANGSHNGQSQSVLVLRTQTSLFSVLGANPLLGRVFTHADDQPENLHAAVLTYGFWKESFGGREDVVNSTLELDNEKYTVVGVMPSWFRFPAEAQVFIPLDMTLKAVGPRGSHAYAAVGRLKPNVTPTMAQADLATIAGRLERQFPDTNSRVSAVVVPLREEVLGDVRQKLLLLLAAVGAVLLLACANVANLLLARASSRQKEMSLRAVLGASRLRVIRQLLTESLMLSLAGGAIGMAAGVWLVRLIESSKQLPIPRYNPVRVDAPVLLFTLSLSVLVGIVFGLAPIFQTRKLEMGEELKSNAQTVMNASRFTRLLRDGLVVFELSVSLSLLIVAGLLLRSFTHLQKTDIGIDSHNVVTGFVMLPDSHYPTLQARKQFGERLIAKLDEIPGVQASTVSTVIPLEGGWSSTITVPGDTDPVHLRQLIELNYITPDYFRVYGIPIRKGATFSEQQMESAVDVTTRVDALIKENPSLQSVPPELAYSTLVNDSFVRMFWPNQDPIGKIFQNNGTTMKVVGVVGDVKGTGVRAAAIPQAYFPVAINEDAPRFGAAVSVRSVGDPGQIIGAIRSKLHDLDRTLAIYSPRTMDQVISGDIQDATLEAWLFGSLAAVALVLAAVGLYSVLAYIVMQRTREIGIRMALGAQHGHVLNLVMRHAGVLILTGVFIGLAGALLAAQMMGNMLYGVTSHDPLTFSAVISLLTLVALAACLIPVRRATHVDPMVALRYE